MSDQEFRDHFMRMIKKAYLEDTDEEQSEWREFQILIYNLLTTNPNFTNAFWDTLINESSCRKSWELPWRNDD